MLEKIRADYTVFFRAINELVDHMVMMFAMKAVVGGSRGDGGGGADLVALVLGSAMSRSSAKDTLSN